MTPKPLAPEGCVYGPWWDEGDGRWYCYCQYRKEFALLRLIPDTPTEKCRWIVWDARYRPECKQLLRLATELAQREARIKELEAQEPDEEGQAVLWLMTEKRWAISHEHGQWIRVTFTRDGFVDFHTINPIEEAKRLGWGGVK